MSARLQSEIFDIGTELRGFGAGGGAVVAFSGLVRDEGGRLTALEIEHYPGMTEKALTAYGAQAAERFGLADWRIIHRHGRLAPGDDIVLVIAASAHREAAFEACHFLIDWLKTKAPFWKLEEGSAGSNWVDAKDSDDSAAQKWDKQGP